MMHLQVRLCGFVSECLTFLCARLDYLSAISGHYKGLNMYCVERNSWQGTFSFDSMHCWEKLKLSLEFTQDGGGGASSFV